MIQRGAIQPKRSRWYRPNHSASDSKNFNNTNSKWVYPDYNWV